MSKNNKDDNGGMKSAKHARGSSSFGGSSRPSAQRTPSGSDKSHLGVLSKEKPQGSLEKSLGLTVLTQSGIVELLNQDDRPTFVLDLAEQTTTGLGALKIVFANASLRAVPGVLDTISGLGRQGSPRLALDTPFSDFKSWCTSYVKDNEPRNVYLPSFSYAAITWTSSNLQKRFRVFRGQPVMPNSINLKSMPKSPGSPSASPAIKEKKYTSKSRSAGFHTIEEPLQDYFGPAGNVHVSERESSDGHGVGEVTREMRKSRLTKPSDIPLPLSPGFSFTSTPPADDGVQNASTRHHQYAMHPNQNQGFFDWTRLVNAPSLPRHVQFVKSIDWASTSLGPIEGWSSELRSMCNFIMASPHPAAMYWGPDYIIIYNEPYIYLAGQKHPQLMGQSYREAWAEIWDSVKDVFHRATKMGQTTMKEDDCLFIQRATMVGSLEEAWFDWSIIPLVGSDGSVVGLYNPAFEKTKRKVGERRLATLSAIGERTSTAKDVKTFWKQVISGLEANVNDAPFFLLYSVNDHIDSDSQSSLTKGKPSLTKSYVLEGSVGVPAGHSAATPEIDPQNKRHYLARIFSNAAKNSNRPLLLSVDDGTLDRDFLDGLEMRGYPEPCNFAVCCPVQSTRSETLGYFLIGINPRRPYDDKYSTFIQMLSRQISTAVASVVLFEEEIRAGERARRRADRARLELSEQLAVQKQVAMDTERKFTQMAKFAPVGIFMAGSDGVISYRNDKWYEIMKMPITAPKKDSTILYQWMDAIHDDDKERIEWLWSDLVHEGISMCTEVRFKSSWADEDGNIADTWVLASGYPDKDDDGNVRMIYGSITDISRQKWVELREKKRMEAAVELKRQQENFVDIVSHELRNPIAAMFLCSEEITNILSELLSKGQSQLLEYETSQGSMIDVIREAMESANTITQCAQHQKRIVDDILTMSKMDSALLLVTPSPEQPEVVVRRTLKMFEQEAKTARIRMEFQVDNSFRMLEVDWVQFDRSRLAQVLINLVTNAIKFTTTQQRRVIIVTLSATMERPSRDGRVSFFPPRIHKPDLTENAEWGEGEQLYMHIAVKDTGRGLSDDEKKLLFLRFSQASASTHVQYGGSGLGLFISRELVELQGGEIGVASQSGKGSTFAFFIKIRRATKPQDTSDYVSAHAPSTASHQSIKDSVPTPSTTTDLHSETASTQHSTPPSSEMPPRPTHILIVDDDTTNQAVLKRALEKQNFIAKVASNGQECLRHVKSSTFWSDNEGVYMANGRPLQIDVILMDKEMPIMNGIDCTKAIRELEREGEIKGHIPIILVSGDARASHVDLSREIGFVSSSL